MICLDYIVHAALSLGITFWYSPLVCLVQVTKVEDTAGAGDCFLGALAAYHSRGLPLEGCIKRANAVAAMSVQKKGCQASYPYAKDLGADLQLPSL